jgi:Fe2+ or Zn2+ uptake regulation protein
LLSLSQSLNKEINATTIYRNLELLDTMHLLYKSTNDHNITHYKLICSEHHHHHLICNQCGRMEAIDYCPILPSLEALVKAHKFTLLDHSLELFGLCDDCNNA